jgi:beta-galactosidase
MHTGSFIAAAVILSAAVLFDCAAVGAGAPRRATGARRSQTLDGEWRIVFDREDAGKRRGWFQKATFDRHKAAAIPVPSCWEETEQDYEGVGWYGRTFRPPAAWRGRHVRLRFGAVNYIAEVWLNGEVAGRHEGGYTPFELDVSDLLKLGEENFLAVRVVGPVITKDEAGGLIRDEAPHWRGGIVGGIWQSVRLIATHRTFIRDVFAEPRLPDAAAVAHVDIANSSPQPTDATVTVTVAAAEKPQRPVAQKTSKVVIPPGGAKLTAAMAMKKPALWSPAHPHLYLARVELKAGGRPIDEVTTRFGMREFTIRSGDFLLNGERIRLKAAFWEGLYPSTLAHPRKPGIVRKEIRLAKEAGFNLLRPWRMPSVPLTLDLADEMGILLVASPPIECMRQWPAETPQLEQRWTSEVQQLVLRDRNHPSIICWEVANEIIRRSMLRLRHKVSLAARRLDPTRLILDESGGSRSGWGAHAYLPHSTVPARVFDRHRYLRSPVNDRDYRLLATDGQPGRVGFMSEVGYGALGDLPRNVARYEREGNPKTPDSRYHKSLLRSLERCMDAHGLREIFPDASALCLATQEVQAVGNKLQVEALRINPNMDGYCLHAFTGGDWVLGAGILDIWREPKKAYAAMREVNQPLYLAIRLSPQNVYAAKGGRLRITAVNDGPPAEGELAVSVTDPAGREVWSTARWVRIAEGVRSVMDRALKTAGFRGEYTISVGLRKGPKTLSENRCGILVIDERELKPPVPKVAMIDFEGRVRQFLARCGVECGELADGPPTAVPMVVAARGARSERQRKQFVRLMDRVRGGGVAIFLRPPSTRPVGGPRRRLGPSGAGRAVSPGPFPLKLRLRRARGHWVGVYHYARRHPIFDGLPTGGFLGQPYQNVVASETIVDLKAPAVVGCVSWDFQKNYLGPTDAWHGTDLAIVPHGKGGMILSMLQLVDHLGADPVADRILLNMIGFAARAGGAPRDSTATKGTGRRAAP